MNNDASPSSSDASHNEAHSTNPQASVEEESNSQQHKTRLQREKRGKFLDDLIRNIDIMIYCELSILYYMEYIPLRVLPRPLQHPLLLTILSLQLFTLSFSPPRSPSMVQLHAETAAPSPSPIH